MSRSPLKIINIIILILLLVSASIYQGRRAWLYLSDWIRPALSISSSNAIERSTAIAFHENFTKYIHFLRTTIPDSATVIIMTSYPDGFEQFGNLGLDQYFLFPRDVVLCSSMDDCMNNVQNKAYVIYQNGSPSLSELPSFHLSLYTESLGVYIP